MIKPSVTEFQQLAEQGSIVPVFREILADLDTPVSAFLKVAEGKPYAFLLESVQGGEKWGRYSLLGVDPAAIFQIEGRRVEIQYPDRPEEIIEDCDPIDTFRTFMDRYKPVPLPDLPRFHGGAVGYFGYDIVRCFEDIPNNNPDPLQTPDGLFMLTDTVLIFDNLLGKLKVVVNARVDGDLSLEVVYRDACARIDTIVDTLRQPLPPLPITSDLGRVSESDFKSEMSREAFEDAVVKAKKYIAAGDIMQVVLSQRLSIPFPHTPIALYRALRTTNPSPYLFLMRLKDFSLVGSSPEILVRQEGEIATVRPIAGTRPRGETVEADLTLENELLDDPKERAEHIMLVDLGRNDLGRIAEIGSVSVTEQFIIERYSHVMHIVSNVEAQLKKDLDSFDIIAATFPAGTVSGAPKIRAMEIIDELEVSKRGAYAGAVGYISYSGHMDLAITIRTAVIKDETLFIQAGAGIVADSQPDREFDETMNKARAVFKAVDLVQRGME
ncbi:MAG: anthranilate synthase component I [Magnetococcales bacterium]|nr:anthranilate synthase component I [Magnetococcales bacterium]